MDAKERFLIEHKAIARSHSSRTLFDHLVGTRALLIDWSVETSISDAGLFHAVYGTESFPTAIVSTHLRQDVQAVIGREAEFLAYAFGVMTKQSFYANLDRSDGHHVMSRLYGDEMPVSDAQLNALCHISVANWLEQRPRVGPEHRFIRAIEFRKMLDRLNSRARAALASAYGFKDA
jgi:hypothetical protein